jgi:hypothetical protein
MTHRCELPSRSDVRRPTCAPWFPRSRRRAAAGTSTRSPWRAARDGSRNPPLMLLVGHSSATTGHAGSPGRGRTKQPPQVAGWAIRG